MKPPFLKGRKLDLSTLEDWPRKAREDKAAAIEKPVEQCPYCSSKKIVKRGVPPQRVKGKKFPLKTIIDGLSYYNMGYTREESCGFLKEHYGLEGRLAKIEAKLEKMENGNGNGK